MDRVKVSLEINARLWERVEKAMAEYEGIEAREYVELALIKQVLSDEHSSEN